MNAPGFRVHPIKGRKNRYAMSVNGPFRIAFFTWRDGDALMSISSNPARTLTLKT